MEELIAFMKAQLAEDERRNPWPWWAKGQIRQPKKRARITREITVKRRLIEEFTLRSSRDVAEIYLATLAAVWSDRPGYKREWMSVTSRGHSSHQVAP